MEVKESMEYLCSIKQKTSPRCVWGERSWDGHRNTSRSMNDIFNEAELSPLTKPRVKPFSLCFVLPARTQLWKQAQTGNSAREQQLQISSDREHPSNKTSTTQSSRFPRKPGFPRVRSPDSWGMQAGCAGWARRVPWNSFAWHSRQV